MNGNIGMIEAIAPTASIRRAYDWLSFCYGTIVAPLEQLYARLDSPGRHERCPGRVPTCP